MDKQKLELRWIGKEKEIKVEPRILIKREDLSYGDKESSNLLIHGDNLLSLKSLEQEYVGKVKCIYIDPPYNTGSAYEHYDDNLEHSTWLNLMKPRLELLRNLLSEDGSIWISIDTEECHYLKVLCDEVFGRSNFIDEIVWQRAYAPINLKKTLSRSHDYILVYAKYKSSKFKLNTLPHTEEGLARYKNPDNDPRGVWQSGDMSVGPAVEENIYEITTPSGRKVLPPKGRCWLYTKKRFEELNHDNRIWFGEEGDNVPRIKRFLSEVKQGVVAMTLWSYSEVGHTQDAKREVKAFNSEDVFTTPKPERLIERIIMLATEEGDIVLDSFLGSGTTAAVAHKMKRKWIGIELGEHAYTHCKPRLDRVIDGKDEGGITKAVGWEGGGGYSFYELAPSLINVDKNGREIISKEYDPTMLAAAMCKHEGYVYAPHSECVYKQGYNGSNYIFTTTGYITLELLADIASELANGEYLNIYASKIDPKCIGRYNNISLHKIPQILLGRCEYGKINYNLNIIEQAADFEEDEIN